MIRILIADDEAVVRETIRSVIQMNFASLCELAVAGSGREVIDKCELFKPDIAFVDVQMPEMSGIRAIQEVRKFDPSTLFIVMTTYNRFPYAQETGSLDITEFLLKPVSGRKIIEVCSRAIRQVKLQQYIGRDIQFLKDRFEIVLPLIEDAFIRNLIQREKSANNTEFLRLLGIREERGCICILEFREEEKRGRHGLSAAPAERVSNNYKVLKKIISYYVSCVISDVMGDRIVLYIPAGRDMQDGDKEELEAKICHMVGRLEKNLDVKFRAGIGNVYGAEEAFISYREALKRLVSEKGGAITARETDSLRPESGFPGEQFENCLKAVMSENRNSVIAAAEMLCTQLDTGGYDTDKKKTVLLKLLYVTDYRAAEAGYLNWERMGENVYQDQVRGVADEQQLCKWFLDRILQLSDDISAIREQEDTGVIARAMKYIETHLAEEITLEKLSKELNLSQSHFSRRFKEEAGKNYIEFLNEVRIRKAKEYLSDPMMSIGDVCMKCGYSDPNYFSRIFRKTEGVSPSEWRMRSNT